MMINIDNLPNDFKKILYPALSLFNIKYQLNVYKIDGEDNHFKQKVKGRNYIAIHAAKPYKLMSDLYVTLIVYDLNFEQLYEILNRFDKLKGFL